ncbi:hypothetical protein AMTR_s00006p00266550 [Amborella trichopoda]|uniref:DUF659 domain-containing protein n=1 Tax=Amborella trichopoda TaxID=13333 RepID=W1P7N8_AMBTC|nr:hypothetical protein AMTR_s00006p00266550 [Amborella trichopoda]
MVSTIQRAGPGVRPPTAYELSGPILDEDVKEVTKWIEEYKQTFSSSKDVSGTKKDANFYVRLYNQIVEEVGDKHVVKFITDNARAFVSASSKLMEKRKHLVWTPCAAHNIDLMLKEIGEIKIVNETLEEARCLKEIVYL